MAIIFFSVAGTQNSSKDYAATFILFLLSILTIIVNGVALSVIIFRISDWGITPNRMAVLGGNLLMLINLILVTMKLFNALRNKKDNTDIGAAIVLFLPVYAVWAFIFYFFVSTYF